MQRTRFSVWLVILAMPISFVGLSGCGSGTDAPPSASIPATGLPSTQSAGEARSESPTGVVQVRAAGPSSETPAQMTTMKAPDPEVVIDTNLGAIRLRLFADHAPATVDNFLANYVERGFYDDTIIHFVDPGFLIAAGGFGTDYGAVRPRAYIGSEADNGLKNVRGTIAMARDPDHIDSANCQFFINLADNPSLDHQSREDAASFGYCVFGEVIEGMDVVDRISQVETVDRENFPSTPQEKVVIRTISRAF
jgi:peptidyl-prolyl cis-trans isomerase A (cyclophilin A)